jgi:glycosyltransferase involved in cell wall biosynthesis
MTKVSVVIPTRNSEWCLPYLLRSLLGQTVQPDEYVVCIGKSEDNTEKLILEFQKQSKCPVRLYYDSKGMGTGYAMSLLVSEATGDLVFWASSDWIMPHDWVERLLKIFDRDEDLVYLCSHGIPLNLANMSRIDMDNVRYDINTRQVENHTTTVSGLIAFRKNNVIQVGNFDPFFVRGQDIDVVVRLISSGAKGVEYSPLGYHFGIYGWRNLKKSIKTGTFFKFIYKYGWKYYEVNPHHFAGAMLRTVFLFSAILLPISLIRGSSIFSMMFGIGLVSSIVGLIFGLVTTHKKVNLTLLVHQMLESIGEFYQLWQVLVNKDRLKLGYGKKWIR